jgi:hypothetical protein
VEASAGMGIAANRRIMSLADLRGACAQPWDYRY